MGMPKEELDPGRRQKQINLTHTFEFEIPESSGLQVK